MGRSTIVEDFKSIMSELSKEMKRLRDSIVNAIRDEETINSEAVTNEVVIEDDQDFHEEFGYLAFSEDENDMFEAEYQGRKVKLNKPMRGDVKKFKVYVKNDKGNVIKVNINDPNMKIKKSNPARRKSFRARHNCKITQVQKD